VTRPTSPKPDRARKRRRRAPVSPGADRQSSKSPARPIEASGTGAAINLKRSRRKRLIAALAAVATIIGVVSSGTALFDWFGKKVNPVTPPPAKIDTQLSAPALLSTRKPLGDYLSDTNQPRTGLSSYQLAEQGFEFLIGIRLQGEQGRNLFLKWSIIDYATKTPLADPIYNQDAARVVAQSPDHARQLPIWVPSPPRRGKFVFRAMLLDETRRPLVQADSKPFTVAKAPSP
jgi:hypothetical protein